MVDRILFQCLAEQSDEAVAIAQADAEDGAVMHFVWCNAAFTAMTGYSKAEISGCRASVLAGPDVAQNDHLDIIQRLMKWEHFSVEIKNNAKAGKVLWQRLTWVPIQDNRLAEPYWLLFLHDITREKDVGGPAADPDPPLVQGPTGLIASTINALRHGYGAFRTDGTLLAANAALRDLFGVPQGGTADPADFAGLLTTALAADRFDPGEGADAAWVAERLRRLTRLAPPYDLGLSDGRTVQIHQSPGPTGVISLLAIDVTQERAQDSALREDQRQLRESARRMAREYVELQGAKSDVERIALVDPLTGLGNRRMLTQSLEERLRHLAETGRAFATLLIDLDRFKLVNDTLGHDIGDQILIRAAEIVRKNTGPDDTLARLGGDEFSVLTTLTGSAVDVSDLADRILEDMKIPVPFGDRMVAFGASIGIALATQDIAEPERALKNADMALYQAKEGGRGRWAFFTEDMHHAAIQTQQTAAELLRACDEDQFVVYYQPQVCARSHRLVGAEALVRWRHPTRGILTPDKFLDIAEDLGVSDRIDRLVFHHVAEDAIWLEERGLDVPKLAVNVSSGRLRDPMLIHDLRRSTLDPARYCIEVLESVFLDETDDHLRWTLDQLDEMGASVAIDDFGTGRASIQSVMNLSPEFLKVDRGFIMPILQEAEKMQLAQAIVQIGRCLNIQVVAEGVESLEHAKAAAAIGCDVLQGYAFGKPMPMEDLLAQFAPEGEDRLARSS